MERKHGFLYDLDMLIKNIKAKFVFWVIGLCSLFLVSCSKPAPPKDPSDWQWQAANLPAAVAPRPDLKHEGVTDFFNIAGTEHDLWVVTSQPSTLLHSVNGHDWQIVLMEAPEERFGPRNLFYLDAKNIFVGGRDGRYAVFDGTQWRVHKLPKEILGKHPTYLDFVSVGRWQNQWVATLVQKDIYLLWDGAENWQMKNLRSTPSVWPVSVWSKGGLALISADLAVSKKHNPVVFASKNGGEWERMDMPEPGWLQDIGGVSEHDVWLVGLSSRTLFGKHGMVIHYDGKTFRNDSKAFPVPLLAVAAKSSNQAFAVGKNGKMYVWDGQWREVTSPIHETLLDVLIVDTGRIYVAGGNGALYYSDQWAKK